MAKIRNISGQDLEVGWAGRREVKADDVVEIPDADLEAYICQPDTWADVTPKSKSKSAAKGDE